MIGQTDNGTDIRIFKIPNMVSPKETGFPTLATYIQSLYRQGYTMIYGPVHSFDELRIKEWGYNLFATSGEHGTVWNVEASRSLSSERWHRQLNADSAIWLCPQIDYYGSDTFELSFDSTAFGTNGETFDFDTINANRSSRFIASGVGNFSAAKNAPPGFNGDFSIIATDYSQIVTQFAGNRLWVRTCNYNYSVWNPWKDLTSTSYSRLIQVLHNISSDGIYSEELVPGTESNILIHQPDGTVTLQANCPINSLWSGTSWGDKNRNIRIADVGRLNPAYEPKTTVYRVVSCLASATQYNSPKQVCMVEVRIEPGEYGIFANRMLNTPFDSSFVEVTNPYIHNIFLNFSYIAGVEGHTVLK